MNSPFMELSRMNTKLTGIDDTVHGLVQDTSKIINHKSHQMPMHDVIKAKGK